ncbi:MAG: biotin/lipoate A/B protein ligase family protein [Candidatus Nanohaloarchaea archaeon]
MKWRIIEGEKRSEAMQHAIDQVLHERMESGEIGPTLRFWHRPHTSIPIGRFQSFRDEVNESYVEKHDIEVVRRITGGGAMFSEPGNVITYSIYIPNNLVESESIKESYRELDGFARRSLRKLGVDVEHVPLNDIEHEEGKIGGAAQSRGQESVLHHTMMSYDLDIEAMLRALKIGEKKLSDKAVRSAEKRVARISDHTDASREKVIDTLTEEFTDGKEWHRGSIERETERRAEKLVDEKFSTSEWNRML